ncbi:MAG TPA: hypothetical protein VLF59_06025 [Candidatus Saccharimonadales bacterium]|nr:hypothetical protein [Candidatus Saccharimonadales bacterium]
MLTGITALEAALGRTFFPKRRRVAIRGNEATIKLRDCTVRFTPHTFPDNTAAIKVDGIPPWRGTNVITDQMARKFGVCTVNHHAPAAVFIAAPDPDYTFTSRRTMRIARRMRRILVHWPELLEPQSDTPSVI